MKFPTPRARSAAFHAPNRAIFEMILALGPGLVLHLVRDAPGRRIIQICRAIFGPLIIRMNGVCAS